MRVLCNVTGDMEMAVQSTIILKHIRENRPDWLIDCQSKADQFSLFHKYCVQSLPLPYDRADTNDYSKTIDIKQAEIADIYWPGLAKHNIAPTFTNWFLREKLAYPPLEKLSRYELFINKGITEKVKTFLSKLPGPKGCVGIHYQRADHDLFHETDDVLQELCDTLIAKGYNPITFRWDGKAETVEAKSIIVRKVHPLWAKTRAYGDAMTTAELIRQCKIFIGIDSCGPLHLAGSTDTRAVGIWTRRHPVYHFDPCPNVTHLLPRHLKPLAKHQEVIEYYETRHKQIYYKGLKQPLFDLVLSTL